MLQPSYFQYFLGRKTVQVPSSALCDLIKTLENKRFSGVFLVVKDESIESEIVVDMTEIVGEKYIK